jgi:2-oxoglutarate dehydrogenase E2 component (dihydrolipoamide succinyltransferase)
MKIEVRTPPLPESVSDGEILQWMKKEGEPIQEGEVLLEIETDKVVLEVPAPVSGVLAGILEPEGTTVSSEQVLGHIEQGVVKAAEASSEDGEEPGAEPTTVDTSSPENQGSPSPLEGAPKTSPAVRKALREKGLEANEVKGSGREGRILKQDVLAAEEVDAAGQDEQTAPAGNRAEERVPMTRLRKRIAERLHEAVQSTAMLTTFNEINMQPLMALRQEFRDDFEKVHGARLGFMSMFVKAAAVALQRFPEVNASLDGEDVIYHGYCDVGIAVASSRGLVVPILRNAELMSMAQIEKAISDYAVKAKEGKLAIEDLSGGTFTITNGGVFGSLFSTPILNPPQSAILGMHGIQKRVVVEGDDQMVVRPMMYVALSYDHRIIDGQSAVLFLRTIKDLVEKPQRMLLEV